MIALLLTPLRFHYVLMVLSAAVIIVWQDFKARRARARYRAMLVYPDFSVTLIDRNGSEIPVEHKNQIWASPILIVLPVRASSGALTRLLIARSRNDADAFRRFYVISRFGFAVDDSERHNVPQSNVSGA